MEPMAISPESKLKSADRVLILEPIDGKKPLSSTGLVDPRLFKDGEEGNRLHAVMDGETCLWSLKYDKGSIPPGLNGRFTSFKNIKKFAEDYFLTRNIKITEVKD